MKDEIKRDKKIEKKAKERERKREREDVQIVSMWKNDERIFG